VLVPAAFAVVSTHQSALGPSGGLCPVLLVFIKTGLCPSSGDINRRMMMMIMKSYMIDFLVINGMRLEQFTVFLITFGNLQPFY
jgi:predicted transporter